MYKANNKQNVTGGSTDLKHFRSNRYCQSDHAFLRRLTMINLPQ